MKYLLGFLSLIFNSYSFACTCATPSIEEAYINADYVYIGKIESATLTEKTVVTNYLTIVKEFKGARDTDILISEVNESFCASPAAVGYKYVVFGKNGSVPKLQACSQTQVLFGGKKELVDKLNELAANK